LLWASLLILDTSVSLKSNTADGAYEAAGYRKHRGNAARLSANECIKDRVREIQAMGAERAAVTVQSLIDEAEQARIKAMDSPNGAAAAVGAITAKGEARRPVARKGRSAHHRLHPV
jgi:phage terminase small subunit